jgi:HEAT repeat protein
MVTMSWVLAAVTLGMQQPAAAPVPSVPPLPQLPPVGRLGTELPALGVRLGELFSHGELSELAALSELSSLESLRTLGDLSSLESLRTLGDFSDAAVVWNDQDPGDSLYRAARRLLNRGRYADAGAAFADLIRRYPRSDYTPDAYYWRAFALYKTGDVGNYREARTVLEYQERHFRNAATRGEAETLYARIQGELAQQGDSRAAEWVRNNADRATTAISPTASASPSASASASAPASTRTGCPSDDDDDDPRIAALNALLQMDAEAAVPILKKVLARRDPCSVALRRKAVFIISQKHTDETEDILLGAARSDPDAEVREQAVFWLSQVGSERAVSALDSILHSSTDEELQKKAIFALSQIRGARAGQILRDFAEQAGASDEAREQAIFWLSQQHSAENAAFLRSLYSRLTSDDLKEKVIFSLSQMGTTESARWLLDLAQNEREPVEMRKKALFWAGQTGVALSELTGLYDRTSNVEIKEQLIFVYSQRRESEAVDKLIDIAKNEPNRELRKKAVFWLGQSRDPRARQALLDIINQ